MNTMERRALVPAALVLVSLGFGAARAEDPHAPPAPAVATVGSAPITAEELKAAVGNQLIAIRTEEYNVEERVLQDMIAKRLLDNEAAARKITVEELTKAEVDAKTVPVGDGDVKAMYEQVKAQLQGIPEAQAVERVRGFLAEQRTGVRRAEFLRELRSRGKVKILLEPPRVSVEEGDGPSKGPKGAPVTIIEFSDFQCPYCGRVAPVLKRVEERYGDRIRLVYRDFPLSEIHKEAGKAAEAGACAREQGKFWEMYDQIFSHQQSLSGADLKKNAKEIGLDVDSFTACLDSGRQAPAWQAHAEAGRRLGVTGTPAFFVNGRLMTGAHPFESFASVIEDELERAGVPVPPPTPEKAPASPKPAPGTP